MKGMIKDMIKVNNVSMRFNLGIEKNFSLKQFFVDTLSFKTRIDKKKKTEFWALTDVSFNVSKGEVVGFIGSNGAGKSTLLKIIAGVMKPTKGSVEIGGNICPMIELGAGFDMDLTARENIFLNGAVLGYDEKFMEAHFQEIVDFAELHNFLDMPIKNYSSGMAARLGFSIATMVNPDILICDEVLAVGDVAFQKKCERRMAEMRASGTTLLFVSHSMESVRSVCENALWLSHGKVMAMGKVDDVSEKYMKYLEEGNR